MKKAALLLVSLLVVGTFVAGCASITGRTAGEIIDDNVIVTEINAKIVAERDLSYWKIDVNSKEGNVVLTGFAASTAAVDKAGAIARSVKGVKSVQNLLKIQSK